MQNGSPPSESIDPDQAYFWTEAWQASEHEADQDIAAGRVCRFEKAEDLIAHLREHRTELPEI